MRVSGVAIVGICVCGDVSAWQQSEFYNQAAESEQRRHGVSVEDQIDQAFCRDHTPRRGVALAWRGTSVAQQWRS